MTDKISAYHDGELPEEGSRAVEGHLSGCGECVAFLSFLRRASAALDRAEAVGLSRGARRRLREGMMLPGWVRMVLPVARPFAVAAGLLLAVGLPALVAGVGVDRGGVMAAAGEGVSPGWETTAISRDADASRTANAQFADWVVADLGGAGGR